MDTKNQFREEIGNELEELKKMELGSDEYKTTVDGVTKLADRMIELKKLDDERIDRIVKNCLQGVGLVTGIGLTVWGTVVSMKFEKTDSFTSLLGRKWVDKTFSFLEKKTRN